MRRPQPRWTLLVSAPGRPSRSVPLGAGRLGAAVGLLLAALGASLLLGWQLGEVTRLL